jgi:hypothetical protein
MTLVTHSDASSPTAEVLMNAKLQIGNRGKKNRPEWENSIKEETFRTGL